MSGTDAENGGPVHTYPDSFVSANILFRIQKFTRPHVCGFVAFSSVHTYLRKRYEFNVFYVFYVVSDISVMV